MAALGGSGSGCQGSIGDPPGGDGDSTCVGCTPSGVQIADSTRFPRLSHAQWENTVVDLFQLGTPTGLSGSFAPDQLGGKFFDNNNDGLEVTPTLWADYQKAAEDIALQVTSDPALLAKIVPADLPAAGDAKARAWIERFGARAWRRPLEAAEIDRMATLFAEGPTHYPALDPFTAGVRVSLEGFLQSPHFVYRPELGADADANALVALSDYEMASRLSYTLWNTMPDDALFDAAGKGDLTKDASLRAQVDRMLADPRARATIRSFFDQLGTAKQYEQLQKNATMYPDFDPAVGAEMREELGRFVEYVVMDKGGGLPDLFTDRTTFVTDKLAAIYGIDPATLSFDADGFAKVQLDPAQRSGLLTRAGFLAWKGTPSQPDTILRGVYVNLRFICQDLGDPPDAAAGAMLGSETTNRDRVNALTGPGTCGATCHGSFINPVGFAFEHYGALGEYRTEDAGQPIDSSATFAFSDGEKSYKDAIELSDLLSTSPQAHRCFAKHWIEFTLARDLVDADDALIDFVRDDSVAGASVQEMLASLLTSDAFRYRLTVKP